MKTVRNNIVVNGRFATQRLTGVQRYAFEIIRRLSLSLCVISPQPIAPEYESLANVTIVDPIGRFAHKSGLGHLWEQLALPRWMGKEDLLWSPCGAGPLAVENQVVTIHDIANLEHPEWFNLWFTQWYSFLIPRLVHKVKKVIVVSEYTKNRLTEMTGISPEKLEVIYNGIDDRFSPKSKEEISIAQKLLGLPSAKYILSLSSLEPRKNLHRLLEAWNIICHKLPKDIWLVLAGGKGKSAVFKDISFDSLPPRVYFTGYVPDEHLPALYSGAIAFTYVSLYEGFGLPPLEAMACGVPVITSNTTSIPEVVGDAAILVNPCDVEEIADSIYKLINDASLRERLRLLGLNRAKQFSWDKTAKQTWGLLNNVVEELSE